MSSKTIFPSLCGPVESDCCATDCPHQIEFSGSFASYYDADGFPVGSDSPGQNGAVLAPGGNEEEGPWAVTTFATRGRMTGLAFTDCPHYPHHPDEPRFGEYSGYYETLLPSGWSRNANFYTGAVWNNGRNLGDPVGWDTFSGFTTAECLAGATVTQEGDAPYTETATFSPGPPCDPMAEDGLEPFDYCDQACSKCRRCPSGPSQANLIVVVDGITHVLNLIKQEAQGNTGYADDVCKYIIEGTILGEQVGGFVAYHGGRPRDFAPAGQLSDDAFRATIRTVFGDIIRADRGCNGISAVASLRGGYAYRNDPAGTHYVNYRNAHSIGSITVE